MTRKKSSMIISWVNMFELAAIVVMLFLAFTFQFTLHELPCPLCLLQRFGFLAVAFGFLLNMRFGYRPSHYAVVLLSALFTAFVALRQISLHVIPGDSAYGSPFLGLHLYTWSFIAAVTIIVVTTLLVATEKTYVMISSKHKWSRRFMHLLFILVALLLIANIGTVLFECGLLQCPDNPTKYNFLFFRW